MKIIKDSGSFFYEIKGKNKHGCDIVVRKPVVEITYGYTRRNKQNCPTTTVAIIPQERDGRLFFGIGVAFCSKGDQVIKKEGRGTATNRAIGTLSKSGDIDSKQDEFGRTRLLGVFTSWEDAHIAIQDLGLDLTVITRISKALIYLKNSSE